VRCDAAGVVSEVVQHVVVPIVERPLCNRLYDEIADKVKLDISDDMMCAGIEEGGRDACQVPATLFLSLSLPSLFLSLWLALA